MENISDLSNFIWGTADLIRDTFKRGKYQDVILPFTVLRRIDCVLEPTKEKVLEAYNTKGILLDDPTKFLSSISGYAFYNISPFTFERLLEDYKSEPLKANLIAYINGFSPNMREVLEKFDFENTIKHLVEANLLFEVMQRFKKVDLHPNKVKNMQMGYLFEDLIRKFNEALNENPGEHFTPPEVIRLMVKLTLSKDPEHRQPGIVRKIYDPCCGTGGMLTTTQDEIFQTNPAADVYFYGQEVNPETFAVCKSDLYIKSAQQGREAENIRFGSTLSNDLHALQRFHYMYANPPYGKEWRRDEGAVRAEAEKNLNGRFSAGLPRISDGQLLFLQHMIAHMHETPEQGISHIAIVMNGSPLFTGDAGSGESEIRRWILENDWLEAIIALPEQLFYNTGIATYVWILSNCKTEERRGKVQLINATDREFWEPMRKSLGDKRRYISEEQIEQIRDLFVRFEENERSKIFPYTAFGYRKISIERPLRLNFQADSERIARLSQQKAFTDLATSKKKKPEEKSGEDAEGRALQASILAMLRTIPDELIDDRVTFEWRLDRATKSAGLKLAAPVRKAILAALSERDETAKICRDKDGLPEPDPELHDTENVPLVADDPEEVYDFYTEKVPLGQSVGDYFKREVAPYLPDAWVSPDFRDAKDGKVGKVGYEINFNRYFYKYQPPRPLEEIEADIKILEKEIVEMLREVAG